MRAQEFAATESPQAGYASRVAWFAKLRKQTTPKLQLQPLRFATC
jgi:hypothetical protein